MMEAQKILAIDILRPTQAVVGLLEVQEKIGIFSALSADGRLAYLTEHPVPFVVGPKSELFMIDRHHLARALHMSGHRNLVGQPVADLSTLDHLVFWQTMREKGWVYLKNQHGLELSPHELPRHIADLKDDPYRSLAAEIRKRSGFLKDPTPFSEFKWAQFFREQLPNLDSGDLPANIIAQAMLLCRDPRSSHLPGYKK